MIHVVLGAFSAACFAHFCAHAAKGCGELTSPRHVGSGEPADLSAINIQSYAACHTAYILLFQARDGAVVTGGGASMASVDA
jgi:hypothetical protein